MMDRADSFELRFEKHIPAALVAAFFLQAALALFWAGSESERVHGLEATVAADQEAIHRVAVLEEQTKDIKLAVTRIEARIDRVHEPQN